jgi:hypothetical protein
VRSIEIEPVAFPFYLYRADADTDTRSKSLLQACKLITNVEWKMDPKNAARLIDTDWMRRLTFGLLRLDEVRADVGDIPDLRRIMTTVRVARHFRHGLASGDRHDPEFAASKFGKPRRCQLT